MAEDAIIERRDIPAPSIHYLTPIERFIIGDSVIYHGEFLNSGEFKRRLAAREGIGEDIFLPIELIQNPSKIQKVQIAREKQKYLAGLMGCFDSNSQIELSMTGDTVPALELSPIDPATGLVRPSWRIRLQNERSREIFDDHKSLATLALSEQFKPFFNLEFQKEGELYLSFNPR
jgi:hypothetical protein